MQAPTSLRQRRGLGQLEGVVVHDRRDGKVPRLPLLLLALLAPLVDGIGLLLVPLHRPERRLPLVLPGVARHVLVVRLRVASEELVIRAAREVAVPRRLEPPAVRPALRRHVGRFLPEVGGGAGREVGALLAALAPMIGGRRDPRVGIGRPRPAGRALEGQLELCTTISHVEGTPGCSCTNKFPLWLQSGSKGEGGRRGGGQVAGPSLRAEGLEPRHPPLVDGVAGDERGGGAAPQPHPHLPLRRVERRLELLYAGVGRERGGGGGEGVAPHSARPVAERRLRRNPILEHLGHGVPERRVEGVGVVDLLEDEERVALARLRDEEVVGVAPRRRRQRVEQVALGEQSEGVGVQHVVDQHRVLELAAHVDRDRPVRHRLIAVVVVVFGLTTTCRHVALTRLERRTAAAGAVLLLHVVRHIRHPVRVLEPLRAGGAAGVAGDDGRQRDRLHLLEGRHRARAVGGFPLVTTHRVPIVHHRRRAAALAAQVLGVLALVLHLEAEGVPHHHPAVAGRLVRLQLERRHPMPREIRPPLR